MTGTSDRYAERLMCRSLSEPSAESARQAERRLYAVDARRFSSYGLVGRAAGSIASNAALCVGVRASLISYPVRFSGLLPGYPSLGGADWHVAPRGHAMLRSWPQGWVSGRRHMMTQESLLDALGAGGPDALVDGERPLQVGGAFMIVAVLEVAAADSFQGTCFF